MLATPGALKHPTIVPPELLLISSILTRAISDATTAFIISRKDRRAARVWICNWGSVDKAEPFSFPWVCIQLNLDPFQVRKTVLKFKNSKKPGIFSGRYTNECLASFLNLDVDEPFQVNGFRR